MYTLIGSPKTRAFRVLWAMEEMGLPYQLLPEAPRSDKALEANPTGKIPSLLVDGSVIIDSVAIIQYLADKHDQLTFPAGTIDRAHQDSFTQFICDEIDGALWTGARNSFINPEEHRVPAIKDVLKWEFQRSIKALDQRLGTNEFLMGAKMTIPDILLAHCGGWARNAEFPIESDNIKNYFKRMIARDGYKRADAIRNPRT
jgi:glutathione S-transferase